MTFTPIEHATLRERRTSLYLCSCQLHAIALLNLELHVAIVPHYTSMQMAAGAYAMGPDGETPSLGSGTDCPAYEAAGLDELFNTSCGGEVSTCTPGESIHILIKCSHKYASVVMRVQVLLLGTHLLTFDCKLRPKSTPRMMRWEGLDAGGAHKMQSRDTCVQQIPLSLAVHLAMMM